MIEDALIACLKKMAERGIPPRTKAGLEYIAGWTRRQYTTQQIEEALLMSGYLESILDANPRIEEILALSSLPNCGTYVLFFQGEKHPNPWAFADVQKDFTLAIVQSYTSIESAVSAYHKIVVT